MTPRGHAVSIAYGQAALRREEAKVRAASPGQRNKVLYDAAYDVGRLVHGGCLDKDAMWEALLDAALACGLPETEALDAIGSGLVRSEERPRRPAPDITTREEAVALVKDYEDEVIDRPWLGRDGGLLAVVLHVVIALAHEAGGPRDIPLSVRRVAAGAVITRQRAARALALLRREGYLRLTKHARQGYPHHYTLTLPNQEGIKP